MSNTIRKLYEQAARQTKTDPQTCELAPEFSIIGYIAGQYCKFPKSSHISPGAFKSWFAGYVGDFYTISDVTINGKQFDVSIYHYKYLLTDEYRMIVDKSSYSDNFLDNIYISDFMQSAIEAVAAQLEN